jgi:5-methylcytosine-specific restriction endonuclease McrBC GTP-binding regulatory subunit McrB
MSSEKIDIQEKIKLLKSSKNLILTGAPGTGKTYLAKEIAKSMNAEWKFVQFHPSYDYTDFVEGLRPTPPDENGNIGFERKDGVFKEFCKKVLKNIQEANKTDIEQKDTSFSKEISSNTLFKKILEDFIEESIAQNKEYEYLSPDKTINKFAIEKHKKDNSMFYARILSSNDTRLIKKINQIKVFENANSIKKPKDIHNLFENRKDVPKTSKHYDETFMFQILNRLRDKINNKEKVDIKKTKEKDFVFIIDEINRGEISKIFGELFFSIDPGYRGKEGKVQTQYANLIGDGDIFKDGFYVPETVYIIGTMNDIDRSVESFDFAMRRRFTWVEITAKESAENMKLPEESTKRMKSLNEAISNIEGLNSSYHIGAAYFLKLKDDNYKDLWNYHLKSLLFEYLRGMPDAKNNLKDLEKAYNLKPVSGENKG